MNLKSSGDSTGFEPMTSAMRCLKSNEDMILALGGQFKLVARSSVNQNTITWRHHLVP